MAPSRFSHALVNSPSRILGSPYHLSQRRAVFVGIERSDSQSSIASSTTSQDTVVVDPYQGEELKLKANAPVASTSARPLQRERTWGSFSGPTAKNLSMKQKALAERTAELLAATAAALTPTRTNTPTPVASSAPVGVSRAESVSCQSSQSSQISWGCSDDDDCDEDRYNRSSTQREDREKTPTPLPDTTLVDPLKPYFEELEDYTPVEPVEQEQEEQEESEIELISSWPPSVENSKETTSDGAESESEDQCTPKPAPVPLLSEEEVHDLDTANEEIYENANADLWARVYESPDPSQRARMEEQEAEEEECVPPWQVDEFGGRLHPGM